MPPACPGVEMCGSTATSTTSVPTQICTDSRTIYIIAAAPEAPPKATRAATGTTRATTATTGTTATTATASNNRNHTKPTATSTAPPEGTHEELRPGPFRIWGGLGGCGSRASRGRKFQKKKTYIAKKEFAYRMHARTISLLRTSFLLFHGGMEGL